MLNLEIRKSESGRSFYKGHSLRLNAPLGQFRQHNRLTAISQIQSLPTLSEEWTCVSKGRSLNALPPRSLCSGDTGEVRARLGDMSPGEHRPPEWESASRGLGRRTAPRGPDWRGRPRPRVTPGMKTDAAVTGTQRSEQPRVGTASVRRNAGNRKDHSAPAELRRTPQPVRGEKPPQEPTSCAAPVVRRPRDEDSRPPSGGWCGEGVTSDSTRALR